jgi:hypothetical protein
LEKVRAELVAEQKKARQTEQARRLTAESERIAAILNNDFREHRRRLEEIRSATVRQGGAVAQVGSGDPSGTDLDVCVEGIEHPGIVENTRVTGRNGVGPSGRQAPKISRTGDRTMDGPDSVNGAGGEGVRTKHPRGGFRVDYRSLGPEEDRSIYDTKSMTILINLAHPVVGAALGSGGVEDPAFRKLSYEIAFAEYAVALAYEMAQIDPNMPPDEVLFDVRSTLNRVARSAVTLYRG